MGAVKQLTLILFLFGFCVNQLHLVETIASIHNTVHIAVACNSDEEAPESEKTEIEKELEDMSNSKSLSQLFAKPFALLNSNFGFINLMHSHPFTQRDIKPPCNV